MIHFLKALLLLPIAVAVVLLAVANRAPVQISFDPFTPESPELATSLPLFAVIFLAVMAGVVIGGTATWLAQGRHRRERRRYRREVQHLKTETDRLRAQASSGQASSGLPALPARSAAS
jgi:uncharacterized integral membrane protein